MSVSYSEIRIALDKFEGGNFAPAGHKGDWLEAFISFEGDLPVKIPGFVSPPRVIITPVMTTKFNHGAFNVMTPVCVARDVTTAGFKLAARNAEPDFGGSYAFNWVAIEESAGIPNEVPAFETGTAPPRHFGAFRDTAFGNRTFRDHVFYGADVRLPDPSSSSVQLTSTDLGTTGHSVPAAGIVSHPFEDNSVDLTAHNTDIVAGACAFQFAAFSFSRKFDPATGTSAELSIETGYAPPASFQPSGKPGDWNTWNITFKSPFARLPVVLVTACKTTDIPEELNPAVLGVVQALTPNGFRLAARSSDIGSGHAGFYWIAIGD